MREGVLGRGRGRGRGPGRGRGRGRRYCPSFFLPSRMRCHYTLDMLPIVHRFPLPHATGQLRHTHSACGMLPPRNVS